MVWTGSLLVRMNVHCGNFVYGVARWLERSACNMNSIARRINFSQFFTHNCSAHWYSVIWSYALLSFARWAVLKSPSGHSCRWDCKVCAQILRCGSMCPLCCHHITGSEVFVSGLCPTAFSAKLRWSTVAESSFFNLNFHWRCIAFHTHEFF